MKISTLVFAGLCAAVVPTATEGATVRVPADFASIQQAIDAAASGDTVLVAPGTYAENLTFRGKAILVASEQGPETTIIDGGGRGSVIAFTAGEGRGSAIRGFTIRNGANAFNGGGGLVQNSSPTIAGNWIVNNGACTGAGVSSSFGSPLIQDNLIARNFVYGCSGASGLGVYIGGDSAAELIGNQIVDNSGFANGGGLTLFAAGRAVVRANVIARNLVSGFSPCAQGGGIWMVNFSQATITDNLVIANAAGCGGGFYWGGSTGATTFVNNTFADNDSAQGSAVLVSGVDTRHVIYNNILVAKAGQTAWYCSNASSVPAPLVNSSDVYAPQGLAYGGTCLDQTGVRGNISVDAQFVRAPFGDVLGDYHLQNTSPAVDAGDNAAPQLPALDLDGQARSVDGNQDGTPRVDMGAYEYHNGAPIADAGPDQTVNAGASCLAGVTLDGRRSSDPEGDALTFSWAGPFGTVAGPTPSVSLAPGVHPVTLTVRDARGGSATDTVTITVLDVTAPAIQSASASPSQLTQNNHQLVPVTISVSAQDNCGAVRCQIASVTSNEPIEGTGGGDKSPDWIITGDLTLSLRSERAPKGSGRIYTITVICTDGAGNTATKVVTVSVR
jgi:hypothetical protein